MSAARFSRRTLLIAGTAGAVAMVAVPALVLDRNVALRRILHRLLGPFEMADDEFAHFVADLEGRIGLPSELQADLLHGMEWLPQRASGLLPGAIVGRRERLERQLLAEFTLATGLKEAPKGRTLTYAGLFGSGGCANPWASLA